MNKGNIMKERCSWPGADPLYIAYHDTEWGVPIYDGRELFEKLILDGFQAGLSWITILRKRETFLSAFDNFDPEVIAQYDDQDIERLMKDTGIVRNRLKIEGTVKNARGYLAIQEDMGFSNYLWGFLDGEPLQNNFATFSDIPAHGVGRLRQWRQGDAGRASRRAFHPAWLDCPAIGRIAGAGAVISLGGGGVKPHPTLEPWRNLCHCQP
ncbi:MAG: hypothetical protein COC12_14005 [Rhodobacteraceae bacterium]|nr:MAG: hypothetical protein COC12_14005 [Paracoccaceae bacterium]